jgi:hypothetical protein
MSPDKCRREFIKLFQHIAPQHRRLTVFEDFLDLASLAIRKTTVLPAEGEKIEERYMDVVKRHEKDDVRKMPELLALTTMALESGEDFLGLVAGELELLNTRGGQFFTPWAICEMMARMTIEGDGIAEIIAEKGFLTLAEPACGAGSLILAPVKVMREQGFDPARQLFVEATDISHMAFKMTYLQLALCGVPAMVRRGDSLWPSGGYEKALTPAFFPFYQANQVGFDKWQSEGVTPIADPEPAPAIAAPVPRRKPQPERQQMSLL